MLYQLYTHLAPAPPRPSISARHITALGLNGLLFNILSAADPTAADWLHNHPSPKPYSMAPLYTADGHLAALRYGAMNEPAADILYRSWKHAYRTQTPYTLGYDQTFTVAELEAAPDTDFWALASLPPVQQLTLNFLSPTGFKQGDGSLLFPLPRNVFASPLRLWRTYAPAELAIPDDWLEWAADRIFVTSHQLETAEVTLRPEQNFTGFVGRATFTAQSRHERYQCIWHALAHLAQFSGVGHKTTMGMGAVQIKP